MISVCIPVYNADVRGLVTCVREMGQKTGIRFEILVMDDASPDLSLQKQNASIQEADNIRYVTLTKNVGRNLIRLELANAAVFDHLLFLDADSGFRNSDFLSKYLQADWKTQLIIGGRVYSEDSPQADHLLHWKYGRKREQRNAETRSIYPYRSFLACNFLIPKRHLLELVVDPKLKGYCHEDTFMGMQFEKHQTPIQHIDNPVIHLGLDSASEFLQKQEEALHHLNYIYKTYSNSLPVVKQVRLIQAFEKLNNSGALRLYRQAFLPFKKRILKNLSSANPSLVLLDMYKLGIFIEKYLGH